MPVSVAPINGQIDIVIGKLFFNRRDQFTILLVNRTDAAEMFVVLGDFQHSLTRHIFAS